MSVRIEVGADGHSILFDGVTREDVKRVAVIVDPEDKTAVLRVVRKVADGLETSDMRLEPGVIEVTAQGMEKRRPTKKYEGQRRDGQRPESGGGVE
jgi:hypothetical protein